MNKYEEKAKQFFKLKTQYLSEYIDQEKITQLKITELMDLIESLEMAKTAVPQVSDELDKNIKNYKDEIKSKDVSLGYVRGQIKKLKAELKDFADNICPHENTEYDHEDYHKRDTYYKCNLCGKII